MARKSKKVADVVETVEQEAAVSELSNEQEANVSVEQDAAEPKTSLDELVDAGIAEIASDSDDEFSVLDEEIAVPANIDRILRLYPQYPECFVSDEGFVYPKGTPKCQRGKAILYKNKYYK